MSKKQQKWPLFHKCQILGSFTLGKRERSDGDNRPLNGSMEDHRETCCCDCSSSGSDQYNLPLPLWLLLIPGNPFGLHVAASFISSCVSTSKTPLCSRWHYALLKRCSRLWTQGISCRDLLPVDYSSPTLQRVWLVFSALTTNTSNSFAPSDTSSLPN